MGKSLVASLMGVLIARGVYDLWQRAPIPEWQSAGDPRAEIRIADLLRMSSGLRSRAPLDPDFDPQGPLSRSPLSRTPAGSTPFTGPPPGRSSGRLAPWVAIETSIRS
jgi:CubicO group peptidase (beta-lactamase class C family)